MSISTSVIRYSRNTNRSLLLPSLFAWIRCLSASWSLLPRVELMRRFSQPDTAPPRSEIDFADASLVWLVTDTGVNRIMTMDERDFSRYRLTDGRGFEIL